MKPYKAVNFVKIILAFGCFFGFAGENINAQVIGITNRPRITSENSSSSGNRGVRKPTKSIQVVYKPEYRIKEVPKYIKTLPTGLSITTEPNASVTLRSVNLKKPIEKKAKADGDGVVTFDLSQGKYKLSIALDGYESQESDIDIQAQKIATIPVALKKVTYDFSIQTNVMRGEVRFARARETGKKNADGTIETEEIGGYCVVPIENQKATIKELSEGTYNIDVFAPDAPEYERKLAVIKIPEDIPDANEKELNKTASFKISLDNKLSTDRFNQLTEDAWAMPARWGADTKGVKVQGAGVAIPKNQTFRFYKDFELQTTVRMLENSSVGFVLRAKDDKNYYFIQISGKEPYLVSGYIVKDGKPTETVMAVPNPLRFLREAFNDKKQFTINIRAKGNTFEIFVEDSTGKELPLGNAVFKDNNYPIGAVGFGAIDNSNFEVRRFLICNQRCN